MEKLKKLKDGKHDHILTKILKVFIFSIIMCAPFFSVLAKCLYTLNPNAKDSYYGETINEFEYNPLEDKTEFIEGHTYHFNWATYNNNNYGGGLGAYNKVIYFSSYSNLVSDITNIETELNGGALALYIDSNNRLTLLANATVIYQSNNTLVFDFVYTANTWTFDFTKVLVFDEIVYNNYSYIDNVFYYAVNQLGQENIYSWTKNTGIYGAVNTMTTGLGIDPTNNILAVLITYWSLITAVYVIIDIVVELFVKLTHLID